MTDTSLVSDTDASTGSRIPKAPAIPAGLPAGEAISTLVDAYGGQLYQLGLRFCGNADDAEDLVQETFMRAHKSWDGFQGNSSPATWLYTIASRACQRMKRPRAGQPMKIESLSELLPAHNAPLADPNLLADDPLESYIRAEAVTVLERAIADLPPNFRLPLVLKEIVDFSIAEIAKILGVKEQTVKTRVHRARLLLRKTLGEILPNRPASTPEHSRGACLDLLRLKQDALDKGVDFPLPDSELCIRCRALFDTLDLAHDACVRMNAGDLPPNLEALLKERYA